MREKSQIDAMRAAIRGDLERSGVQLRPSSHLHAVPAGQPEPDPVVEEPEPVAEQPDPAAEDPEPVAEQPDPAAEEPEPRRGLLASLFRRR